VQTEIGGGRNLVAINDRTMSYMDEQQLYRLMIVGKCEDARQTWVDNGRKGTFKKPEYSQAQIHDMIAVRNGERTGAGRSTNNLGHAIMMVGAARMQGGRAATAISEAEMTYFIKELDRVKTREVDRLLQTRADEIASSRGRTKPYASGELAQATKKLDCLFGKVNIGRGEVARKFTYLTPEERKEAFRLMTDAKKPGQTRSPANGEYYTAQEAERFMAVMLSLKKFSSDWKTR
jgi:hypothetical protein